MLPLVRARRALRLDAACLVLGSMAPDFEYFLRGHLKGAFSHTLAGWWAFGVPVALVAAFLWQVRVAPLLEAIAPDAIRRRGLVDPGRGWWTSPARVAGGIAGAAIGVATHLAWDSATHWSGYIVHHVPALVTTVDVPVLGPLPLHRVVQHVSSLVGLVAVVAAAAVAIRARPPVRALGPIEAVVRIPARLAAAGILVACEAFAYARLYVFHRGDSGNPDSLVVAAISGGLLAALVASLVLVSRSTSTSYTRASR